jgi:flagellar motility protein MotE (MotC chaperone)
VAEQRVEQKLADLAKINGEIEALVHQVNGQQAAQIDSLVKIYETMKPKEAARIFEELDMPVLLGVVERMKECKTAPILAAMDPAKAKELTMQLADRRQIPGATN